MRALPCLESSYSGKPHTLQCLQSVARMKVMAGQAQVIITDFQHIRDGSFACSGFAVSA